MSYPNEISVPLLESHEERLVRMAEDITECRTAAAETQVRVDNLGQQLTASSEHLRERIDAGFSNILQILNEKDVRIQAMDVKVGTQGINLTRLNESEQGRKDLLKRWKGAIWGLGLTGAGVAITKFVEKFLTK